MKRRILKITAVALAAIVLTVAIAAATPQGRLAFRVAFLVADIIPGFAIKPQQWFAGPPERITVQYQMGNDTRQADLYLPSSSGKHPAILLAAGVAPRGLDDPRLVSLAESIARAGIAVLIPHSEQLAVYGVITPREVDSIVLAFQYLQQREEIYPARIGVGGFCVGASLALVAATDERIRDDVRFVSFFAGYYDVVDLIKSVVSARRFDGDQTWPWAPERVSVDVVQRNLLDSISNPEEYLLLANRFIGQVDSVEVNEEALSGEARAVYRLLSGVPLEETDSLLGNLSPVLLEDFRQVSPRSSLHSLKAPLLVLHATGDNVVPVDESRRIARNVPPNVEVNYMEFSSFQHMTPEGGKNPVPYVQDGVKLFVYLYKVMRMLE